MSSKRFASHFILSAINRLYSELPDLIGKEDWPIVESQIEVLFNKLRKGASPNIVSPELLQLLNKYDSVRKRLELEINIQDVITQNIAGEVFDLVKSLGLDLDENSDTVEVLVALAYANMKWEVDPETVPTTDELNKND